MRKLIVILAFGATACDPPKPALLEYWSHPQDSEVKIYAMKQCLAATVGPKTTQYNDWDEAIEACNSFADDVARYCPAPIMARCLPQYQKTREDVRSALPKIEGKAT